MRHAVPGTLIALLLIRADAAWPGSPSRSEIGDPERVELSEGPVDLNVAGIEDLVMLPGISASVAGAIVDRRNKVGCFRSLHDLLGVGGLTEAQLVAIRAYVTLGAGCGRDIDTRMRAALSWRALETAGSGGSRTDAIAGDLHFGRGPFRLRLRRRSRSTEVHGGAEVGSGTFAIVIGDSRGRLAHPLAFELGAGVLTYDGALPRPPSSGLSTSMSRREGTARPTTGTGERIRGVVSEIYIRKLFVCGVGTLRGAWGKSRGRAYLASVRLSGRRRFQLWSGLVGWGHEPSGAAYVSADWIHGECFASVGAAMRRHGGAWAVSCSSGPVKRRIRLVVAGRWGRYCNPLGLAPFRSQGTAAVASRVRLSARPYGLGSLAYEEVISSNGEEADLKRGLRFHRRLGEGLWAEWELREEGKPGGVSSRRYGLRLMHKPSTRSWTELLYKAHADGSRSSLCGWRAGLSLGPCALEWGGFAFGTSKSLYFFEREILGLASIKALKGDGIGWYLCLRLESPNGPRPLSFLGPFEVKARAVRGRGSPDLAFIGVQLGGR